mmetsp:Transcript_1865/g.4940  ORF Transcript_1865/g.4940 Transcript_1865/m.4940 type:complete len:81 (-) Transcript_1865:387-629(-)
MPELRIHKTNPPTPEPRPAQMAIHVVVVVVSYVRHVGEPGVLAAAAPSMSARSTNTGGSLADALGCAGGADPTWSPPVAL